ncbi:MAG TPA: hypothetical protein VG778_12180 [Blastocatellia bacterium]|nr:hypothetical protein [Blastocatellia bacterium]
MRLIRTNCPGCGTRLEFPSDFDNVICAACGAGYLVREYEGAINLAAIKPGESEVSAEQLLAELDEAIEELTGEVETLRSREQAAPLQMGCSLFGLFFLAILVISIFMTVAKDYFGRWPFYLTLAVVLALGVARMRQKVSTQAETQKLRDLRTELEKDISALEGERERIHGHLQDNASDHQSPSA